MPILIRKRRSSQIKLSFIFIATSVGWYKSSIQMIILKFANKPTPLMDKIIWTLLAFMAGAVLPIQGGLNTRLGKAATSPVHAAMISFVVGGLALILYILISRQTVFWIGIKEAPAYLWLGGLLGAFYVTITIMIFPKLGPGLTFGLLVAGQMIVSVILEHYNILVAQQNPISAMKMIGIALIIAGVVILEKY